MNKKSIARVKMYLDRGQVAIAYIKSIAYVFMSVSMFKLWTPLEQYATAPVFVILTVGMFVSMAFIGYLDMHKVLFYQEEIKEQTKVNPIMTKVLEDLDEIKRRLK